ncbi:MAG TPA: hypothetical protein VLB79_10330 [Solirubrobacterales bacterium]|nr:hypothetical protein [Solirubrobacterales bacterium]
MWLRACTALAILSVCLTACGDHSDRPIPPGPLAATLAEIGGGGEHGSLGVGWTEPRLARQAGLDPELMARALGPNAQSVVEAAPTLRRRFGVDPLAARRLVSVGGSYAFGLRIDGTGAPGLRAALAGVGRRKPGDGVVLVDVGGYAQVPDPLLSSGVLGLGARDAFGPDFAVLAISENSRAALLGRNGRLIDQRIYRAAADCLGDVVAARMIPDKLLLSVETGIELVAVGLKRDREVLCALGGTAERAGQVEAGLRASLAPGARDPRTGEPMSRMVSGVQVRSTSYEGVEVVRVELSPVGGAGFFFGTIARGSLVQLLNGR